MLLELETQVGPYLENLCQVSGIWFDRLRLALGSGLGATISLLEWFHLNEFLWFLANGHHCFRFPLFLFGLFGVV